MWFQHGFSKEEKDLEQQSNTVLWGSLWKHHALWAVMHERLLIVMYSHFIVKVGKAISEFVHGMGRIVLSLKIRCASGVGIRADLCDQDLTRAAGTEWALWLTASRCITCKGVCSFPSPCKWCVCVPSHSSLLFEVPCANYLDASYVPGIPDHPAWVLVHKNLLWQGQFPVLCFKVVLSCRPLNRYSASPFRQIKKPVMGKIYFPLQLFSQW